MELLRLIVLVFFLSACSTSIVNTGRETFNVKERIRVSSCVTKTPQSNALGDCTAEAISCLEKENSELKSNHTINLEVARVKSDSSSAVLIVSFLSLGLIPTKNTMFTETITMTDSKTNAILAKTVNEYKLEAGWLNYFKSKDENSKSIFCEKILSLIKADSQ